MSSLDPYQTVGVGQRASANEIRLAYRKRAADLHPDRYPPDRRAWASEQMIQLNAARDLLLDAPRRAEYDQRLQLELRKAGWRARQEPSAAAAVERRPAPQRYGLGWSLNVIGMIFLLGLCLYSLPYTFALASLPEARAMDDPWFWLNVFWQLAVGVARALLAPAIFVGLFWLVLANLGRIINR